MAPKHPPREPYTKSGKKKEPKPKLFGSDIFGWGGGLPRDPEPQNLESDKKNCLIRQFLPQKNCLIKWFKNCLIRQFFCLIKWLKNCLIRQFFCLIKLSDQTIVLSDSLFCFWNFSGCVWQALSGSHCLKLLCEVFF